MEDRSRVVHMMVAIAAFSSKVLFDSSILGWVASSSEKGVAVICHGLRQDRIIVLNDEEIELAVPFPHGDHITTVHWLCITLDVSCMMSCVC